MNYKKKWLLFILFVLLIIILDQISKFLVLKFAPLNTPLEVLGNFFRITFVYNERGIFGTSFGPHWLYYLLPAGGIVFVFILFLKSKSYFLSIVYGMIIGGGLGNLIDRLLYGKVIDFLDFGIGNLRWYFFNIADASVVISILLLLSEEIFFAKKHT